MTTAYHIIHINLQNVLQEQQQCSPCLVVVWYKHIPLGHVWAAEGYRNNEDLKKIIRQSIDGAINFYANKVLAAIIFNALQLNHTLELQNALDKMIEKSFPQTYSQPSLSVIVCTRNRTDSLLKCIETLKASNDTDFELIVVDNAPDNDSTKIALSNIDELIYIVEPKLGLDHARNTGAKSASKDIVAYTDDDVAISAEWTSMLKKCFVNPKTMAVTGLVLPVSIQTKSQYIFEKYWSFNKGYQPIVFDDLFFHANKKYGVPVWEIGAGANMAFRKIVFDLVGYFDDRLDVGASGCSGDSEFWYRILADGWQCNYYPQLVVFHNHRADMDSLKKQLFSYMRGQVSSLMVQFEKYGHIGNLWRVVKWLPLYYWRRLKEKIRKRNIEKNETLWLEIKGCISGALFYWNNRRTKQDNLPYPLGLNEDAFVDKTVLVSVIITCYNYGRFLAQAIQSVLNQSHQHIEIIVVDDGSTDETQAIIASYKNIKSIQTNRIDVSAARNVGVKLATGSYILFLDADDYLFPGAIELNLYYFAYYPKAVFVSGDYTRVDLAGNELITRNALHKQGNVYADLLKGNYIGMEGTILYRKELFNCFQFNPAIKTCEFYDLNLFITRYFPVYSHTDKLAFYRIHSDSKSVDKQLMWEAAQSVLKKQIPRLSNLLEIQALNEGFVNWEKTLL